MEHPPPMPSVSDGKNSGNSLLLPLPRENFLATVAKRFFRNFTVTYRRNRLRTFPVWNPLRPPVNISGDGSTFWAMVCLRFYYKMIRRFARWVKKVIIIVFNSINNAHCDPIYKEIEILKFEDLVDLDIKTFTIKSCPTRSVATLKHNTLMKIGF